MMDHDPKVSPAAQADIDDTAEYISIDNVDAGYRFLVGVDETLDRLIDMPGLGTPREYLNNRLSGLRSVPIRGFRNWLLFYRVVQDHVEVIRVLHGARDLAALFLDEPA